MKFDNVRIVDSLGESVVSTVTLGDYYKQGYRLFMEPNMRLCLVHPHCILKQGGLGLEDADETGFDMYIVIGLLGTDINLFSLDEITYLTTRICAQAKDVSMGKVENDGKTRVYQDQCDYTKRYDELVRLSERTVANMKHLLATLPTSMVNDTESDALFNFINVPEFQYRELMETLPLGKQFYEIADVIPEIMLRYPNLRWGRAVGDFLLPDHQDTETEYGVFIWDVRC